MTEEEIILGNELIVKFMGYIYKHEAHEDFSDIGGLYSDVVYYSKKPLSFEFTHDDGRGEGLIIDRDNENFYNETITVITGGYGRYMTESNYELRYHNSWDWLMPVIDKINREFESPSLHFGNINCYFQIGGFKYISQKAIDATFKGVVEFIKCRNKNK